jgi:hypothetical protein
MGGDPAQGHQKKKERGYNIEYDGMFATQQPTKDE